MTLLTIQETAENSGLFGFHPFWVALVLGLSGCLTFMVIWPMFAVWLERKASADFQSRHGPTYVGRFNGWLQTLADSLKLAFKEDIIPKDADRFLFWIAPAVAFCGVFASFIAIPIANGWQVADLDLGLFFILAITAVGTLGVVMAGWSSNNKWSLYGALREAAQLVSYEIPVSLSLLVPILVVGSMRLGDIVEFQAENTWLIFYSPWTLAASIIYFISSLAECKRAPFDLPEAESELVSGFHTEYSGLRFSFFFLEEYVMMFVVAAVAALVFLGGWQLTPFPFSLGDGFFANVVHVLVFLAKSIALVYVQIWLRWTLPRLRIDQVMEMGYKYLTPMAMGCLIMAALYTHYGIKWIPGIF